MALIRVYFQSVYAENRPMKVSVLILCLCYTLLQPLQSYAQNKQKQLKYNNQQVVCVDDVENIGHLNFFTWSAKQILDALAQSEFLKEREWKAIESNPELVLHIKKAADLGLEISKAVCPFDPKSHSNGVYESDDEVDAARHFVMSAYLSFKVGKEKARRFMASHEDNEYANANMMDYYNNELGFNFGESLVKKYEKLELRGSNTKYFIDDIKAEILRRHQLPKGNNTDFMVLTSGPSTCAQKKYPNF